MTAAEPFPTPAQQPQAHGYPRFNVFGRIVDVRREGALWQACRVGADGKRTASGFVIPDFVK